MKAPRTAAIRHQRWRARARAWAGVTALGASVLLAAPSPAGAVEREALPARWVERPATLPSGWVEARALVLDHARLGAAIELEAGIGPVAVSVAGGFALTDEATPWWRASVAWRPSTRVAPARSWALWLEGGGAGGRVQEGDRSCAAGVRAHVQTGPIGWRVASGWTVQVRDAVELGPVVDVDVGLQLGPFVVHGVGGGSAAWIPGRTAATVWSAALGAAGRIQASRGVEVAVGGGRAWGGRDGATPWWTVEFLVRR